MIYYDAEITNIQQWIVYKLKIDSKYNCYHNHDEPTSYPFRVLTTHIDDDDGRIAETNLINHEFFYKERVECEHCHHVTIRWPNDMSKYGAS